MDIVILQAPFIALPLYTSELDAQKINGWPERDKRNESHDMEVMEEAKSEEYDHHLQKNTWK